MTRLSRSGGGTTAQATGGPVLLATFLLVLAVLAGVGVAASLEADPSGLMTFPTRHVDGFRDLYDRTAGYDARSVGRLVLPPGKPPPSGFPAMVILHGSGGEWSGRGRRQAGFLSGHGIASLIVNTFAGHGLRREMRYIDRLRQANIPDQLADAFAALDALSAHPAIDPGRIGVMGYSMGGVSALLTADRGTAAAVARTAARFALHAAFYAPCFVRPRDPATTGAPVLAIWGSLDESTDRAACERYVRELRGGGSEVDVHWLDGAAHGWNTLGPPAFHPTAPRGSPCDYVVGPDGEVMEERTGKPASTDRRFIEVLALCSASGYTIGRNAEAEATANTLLLAAIRRLADRAVTAPR